MLGPCFVMQYLMYYHPAEEGRELVALLLLSSECHVAIIILCLFLFFEWLFYTGFTEIVIGKKGVVYALDSVCVFLQF